MPTEISAQLKNGVLHPYSAEDQERLRDYHNNQIVRVKITGTRKARSLQQLRLYWAACQTVADNVEDPQWDTKEKVDFQCRVLAGFYDPNIVVVAPNGMVQFRYRSIAFKNLSHCAACDYFEKAFAIMAKRLGVTSEDLLVNS